MDEVFPISRSSGARVITSSGQRATLPGGANSQVRIHNAGPNAVCVLAGSGAQVAAFPTDALVPNGAGVVIPENGVEPFSLPAGSTDLHAICLAGETATIYFSVGVGA
jgi:formylmethanofuran dehydrogenase subunit A